MAVGWSGVILTSPLSTPIMNDRPKPMSKQSPLSLSITSRSRTRLSFSCFIPCLSTVSAGLYNLHGQSVVSIAEEVDRKGRQKIHLPLTGIAAGAYYLEVKTGVYRERLFVVVR